MDVPLTDAFLNPTNDNEAFTAPLPPGYIPQPGFEQLGVGPIVSGITGQLAEEVDYKIVDAVRNDLVRIQADLFSFNVARGRDVGLGTLNQVRSDLLESTDPYVMEAVERSGEDLSPYSSWQDFQQLNGLSATVLAQFMAAYPDLVLASQNEIDAFKTANPSIELVNGNTVKGIDRVDLWVGGLAEEHINGGVVGATFWVVLHEQFDRLQEGDRFYYLDRVDDFDFYNQVEDQSFADIIARNTGIEGLSDDVFSVEKADENGDGEDNGDGDQDGDNDQDGNGDGDQDGSGGDTQAPLNLIGTPDKDVLIGNAGGDILAGLASADTLLAGDGDNTVVGGEGDDQMVGGAGKDLMFGDDGDDLIMSGAGNDMVFGGAGRDRIITEEGDDVIDGGDDRDIVDAGAGNDTVLAAFDDGDDVYDGGEGVDLLDLSAITSDAVVDLGQGAFGQVESEQSGVDSIASFENVIGGFGNDTIIANNSVNVIAGGAGADNFVFNSASAANGDHLTDF
jgi:Ca2+-binding RTX toxin-like protein